VSADLPALSKAHRWVLVLEDEQRLRDDLAERLRAIAADFGTVSVAASAEEALQLCQRAAPHIAFVDIRLPGQSGLDFVEALHADTFVVFVTAHEEHAVRAFEQGAVDYLLKPVVEERLQLCVNRLRAKVTAPLSHVLAVLDALQSRATLQVPHPPHLPHLPQVPEPPQPPFARWISASAGRRMRLVAVQDLIYLQSDNKYTRLITRDGEHFVEEAIRNLAPRLDPAEFRQISRAVIVSLREVLMVERDDSGGGQLHLRDREEVLRVSPPFMRAFKAFVG